MASVFNQTFWDEIAAELWENLDELIILTLMEGVEGGILALPANMQQLVDYDFVNVAVLNYAKEYRYSLIRDITDTTRDHVQRAMTDWIQEGSPLSALESRLIPIFSETRAARIAATEVTRVFAAGNRQSWESTGFVNSMVWQTSNDDLVCEICGPLNGTHIGIGDVDAIPPAHVNCRCWLQPEVDLEAVNEQLDEILGL
jgi:SPP1 gp7 family putative phage head morphogenesis protein